MTTARAKELLSFFPFLICANKDIRQWTLRKRADSIAPTRVSSVVTDTPAPTFFEEPDPFSEDAEDLMMYESDPGDFASRPGSRMRSCTNS
jgi:hypothetical protein